MTSKRTQKKKVPHNQFDGNCSIVCKEIGQHLNLKFEMVTTGSLCVEI